MGGEALFEAAGTLRASYAQVDWAATPLGPVWSWSPALRGAVDLALHTRFPITLFWGPDFAMVYNEAYAGLIGRKHPAALGARAAEVFPEAWPLIGPMMQDVFKGCGSVWAEDALVPLQRRGFLEECFFTFSYSLVRGADGEPEGVLDIAAETTSQVQNRRRLELLSRLNAQLADLEDVRDVPARALAVLRTASEDLPVVDIRLDGVRAMGGDYRLPGAPPSRVEPGDVVVDHTPAGEVAWMALGASDAGGAQPLLVALLSQRLAPDDAYRSFLRLVAAALVHAIDRARVRTAELRSAAAQRELSEALQRSLLTRPPRREGLQIAVRYLPAAEEAKIGGDWYDAFLLPDGTLAVAIGDVAGHDEHAAAAMGQVRNVLRGIAYTLETGPATVLSALDGAMQNLARDIVATAVLARLDADPARPAARTMRWSNAGHPPPILLSPDGRARLLEAVPDLLLGLEPGTSRGDHSVVLEPGAAVVFYTDGLVERRGVPLEESLAWLVSTVEDRHGLSAEELSDHLVAELKGLAEDDTALLVLKVDWPSL